jgi:hypothetical protein
VKLRSIVAAFVAAAILFAGILTVGAGGAAHAQTVLLDCDKVAGTQSAKPGITNTLQTVTLSLKATTVPRTCSGTLAAQTGPLAKMTGKVSGGGSCIPGLTGYPTNGKITLGWTNLGPTGKPLASSGYVRLAAGAAIQDSVLTDNGLITKGPGVGADLSYTFLQQPTLKNGPTPQSAIGPDGSIIPGTASLLDIGLPCALGTLALTTFVFGTDGTSLTGPALDSSVRISFP